MVESHFKTNYYVLLLKIIGAQTVADIISYHSSASAKNNHLIMHYGQQEWDVIIFFVLAVIYVI